MEIDDDDDFYAPEEPIMQSVDNTTAPGAAANANAAPTGPQHDEDLEEGEEEDEGAEMEDSDSVRSPSTVHHLPPAIVLPTNTMPQDIDIITERKDGTKAAPPM